MWSMDPACTVQSADAEIRLDEWTHYDEVWAGAIGPTTGVRVCKSHQHIKKGIMSNVTRVKGLIGQCIGLCLSAVHPLNTGHVCVDATVCVCLYSENRQTHSSAVCIARISASPICWAPSSTMQNYKWLWDRSRHENVKVGSTLKPQKCVCQLLYCACVCLWWI